MFDYHQGDVYWCTADVGWVTGHTYIVYGPLANGATTLMFEGVPNYPDSSRFWQVVDKHQVNIFYTAPTAIRALMRDGEGPVKKTSRKSLRLLGSVGEPINPEAWLWYHRVVGEHRCPIVDTWWQTETGGILISPLPGATALKPGSATLPLPGVRPLIVDGDGNELHGATEGNLCLSDSWPGQMRTVYGDHERFKLTYFSTFKGLYFTGDGARRDADGYYWITGRVDDVINVSGHRMGTAEVESALVAHPKVADGVPLRVLDRQAWRHIVGYVPQESVLLHDTIAANVSFGDPAVSRTDTEAALRAAGAFDFVMAMPEGIDTVVGERGARLSGGQRQRIAIARALAHKPSLLILDEPTTALDPETERGMCRTIRDLSRNITVLAISHQSAIVEAADIVYRLNVGRIETLKTRDSGVSFARG